MFFQAVHRRQLDAIVCMYHDQGHGPMKLLAFDSGVNVTLGLPIIRTSVDHGTAFDIAWQGVAFTDSLRHALDYAWKLAGGQETRWRSNRWHGGTASIEGPRHHPDGGLFFSDVLEAAVGWRPTARRRWSCPVGGGVGEDN